MNFNEIDPGIKKTIESVGDLTLPSQGLIGNYVKATTLIFFEIYLRNNNACLPFLTSSYSKDLGNGNKFQLYLISGSSTPGFVSAIEVFRRAHP